MNTYIHIPFCRKKCHYCKFALTPIFSEYKKKKYLSFLKKEIGEMFKKYPNTPIKTIYFGGGTPSILDPQDIEEILALFPKQKQEISFECNPEDINTDFLQEILKLGINRISIGVQSLNDKTLKTIDRSERKNIFHALHCLEKYANSDEIGKVGKFIFFENKKISVNIDLILGLPHAKKGETLENLILLHKKYPFITHTSVYILEKGLYPKEWKKLSISDEEINEEFLQICHFFREKNWNHYEVSNFSQRGFECKHNMGYWNHTENFGFGLSASSLLRENGKLIRRDNALSFFHYYKRELSHEEILSDEQIELEKLLFGLRTQQGYTINENIPLISEKKCAIFAQKKWLIRNGKQLIITEKGIPFLDHILDEIVI